MHRMTTECDLQPLLTVSAAAVVFDVLLAAWLAECASTGIYLPSHDQRLHCVGGSQLDPRRLKYCFDSFHIQ